MGIQSIVRRVGCIALVLCLPPFSKTFAQDETSIWQSLPEETVVAMRIPNGQAVLDEIRETKFGAVMFSEKRKAALLKVLEKHGEGDWAEYLRVLKQYDLTTEELFTLFAGETGYAIANTKDDNDEPLFLGIGWVQPGDELAGKFYEIIGKALEEQDEENAVTRVDVELADQEVMQLRFPQVDTEYSEDFELPDDYRDLPEEEQVEAYELATEQFEASGIEMIVYRTALLSRVGDRLLIAHQIVAPSEDEADLADERLSTLFANVLTAHASGGSDGFGPRLSSDPSVARTLSAEGLPVFDLLADVQTLVQIGRGEADDPEDADKFIRLFGIEELGAFAVRQTMDGVSWNTLVSLAVPAPRTGLMRLLDQEMLEIDPPQWVPASAVRYYQLSFNLGEAYETIKEEVTRVFPEQTARGFMMVETQVQNFAQVALPELLASLGNNHTIMTFGIQSIDLEEASDDDLDNNLTDRTAIVWQLTDEQLWSKLFKVIAPFAGMAPGTEAVEEQGFSGYRMKSGQIEGGLFLGKGYLVLGIGDGVVETTLSALNNPPSGSNALRGSDLYSDARDLLDLEPAMLFELTDNDRYMRMVFDKLSQQFDQLEGMMGAMVDEDDDEEGMFIFDLMRALMPKGDELQGMMGVSVSRTEVNEDGVFLQSVQEAPAK